MLFWVWLASGPIKMRKARIPGGLVPGAVARGRLAFLAARTVTAPPGRDMANSATSPIHQRQPELQVGGVAYRCPIEFRHQVGTLGRPTWRTTDGRTLFWTLVPRRPSHPQPRPRRLPGRGFLARRFMVFGVQFLGHRQRPHLGIVPHVSSSCGGSARPNG